MKNRNRFLILAVLTPLIFFGGSSHASAATKYEIFDFNFAGIDSQPNTLQKYFPTPDIAAKYLDGLAYDIYSNSLPGVCTNGQCGYPYSCPTGGDCGGNTDFGDFSGRDDSEHQFWGQGDDQDHQYFVNGYPGQLMGNNNPFGPNTALRACQDFAEIDGASDSTITESHGVGDDNGDDGSYRNNISYINDPSGLGTGWDIFEANKHYTKLVGGSRNSGNAITSLQCYSSALPSQTVTINGGSSATVAVNQTANLTWADKDYFALAGQTCTASSTAGATAFVVPTPAASNYPSPVCGLNGTVPATPVNTASKTSDPGQTSTLMSVPRDSKGNALYLYACHSDSTKFAALAVEGDTPCKFAAPPSCEGEVEGFCSGWDAVSYCPVAPPTNTISVSASAPGTYTYGYQCTNPAGKTYVKATLIVGGDALPDLTTTNVGPTTATKGDATDITATIVNSPAAPTATGFTNVFQVDDDRDHSDGNILYQKTVQSPVLAAGGTDDESITYTFGNAQTYYVRVCADTDKNGDGTIDESNEKNNCGDGWVAVNVTNTGNDLQCTSTPGSFVYGAGGALSFGATPANLGNGAYTWVPLDGLGTYFNGAGKNAAQSGTLSASTPVGNYRMKVQAAGKTDGICTVAVTGGGDCGVDPSANITAQPDRVIQGGTALLNWSAKGITPGQTCTITGTNGYSHATPAADGSCDVGDLGGSQTTAINTQTTFTINCTQPPPGASDSATVDVVPNIQEF